MLKYCILCVMYIKLIFCCWGGGIDDFVYDGSHGNNTTLIDEGDGYGGYVGYFEHGMAVYDEYSKHGASGKYGAGSGLGPGGLSNASIDDPSENALLPKGILSADGLKDIFKDKWKAWMSEYYRKKALEKEESGLLTSEERNERNDPFWPHQLIGFGKGSSGDVPPPYAYNPNNDEGYPTLCFQPIQKGRYKGIKCDPGPRYAFVAGIKICVAFYFRGCGENQNNFKTKQNCEDICTKIPKAGCDPDTMQNGDRLAYEYSLG